ncbi:MAG: YqaA family protein [Alphaproteobacteria bacterium]
MIDTVPSLVYSGAMLRRLYNWTLNLASHRHARVALGAVAFAESSVFPIPPDILLIPMVLAQRAQAWVLAGLASVASVAGGLAGYAIGYLLFDAVGQPILEFYSLTTAFSDFAQRYNDYGAWIVLVAGVTPIPYKLVTIASGATSLDLGIFMAASIAARGARFFIVAGLLYWVGPPARAFIEERLGLAAIIFVVLLFGGFAAVKYLL